MCQKRGTNVDLTRFNAVTETITNLPSRRDMLRSLAGAGIGLGALLGSAFGAPDADAKKTRRKKKRKKQPRPVFNQFGCLGVGQPCKGDSTICCSGICAGSAPRKGRPDTRVCAAHDTGTCKQDGVLAPCNNRTNCGCFRTTAGSDVCAELFPPSACAACQRDADCLALGFPPGTACALSAIPCESGRMACMVPCGAMLPNM
jgi:hypothetical protein